MEEISLKILKNAAQGDILAFEEIYKKSSGFVYSVAFRVVNNASFAEDITQEVFLKIHKNLKNFRFESAFKTWIYRITANTAINTYKKHLKHDKQRVDLDDALRFSPSSISTDKAVQASDSKKIIDSLLMKLSPGQRICLILREIEGLRYREIAQTLKISINTVRSRIKRAREALLSLGRKEVMANEL